MEILLEINDNLSSLASGVISVRIIRNLPSLLLIILILSLSDVSVIFAVANSRFCILETLKP